MLGIGVNVNQGGRAAARTPKLPASLRLERGRELDRAPLLAAILDRLERGYDALGRTRHGPEIHFQSCERLLLLASVGSRRGRTRRDRSRRLAAPQPRVLAIHFSPMDVNPVTQDWLNSQLDRAQSAATRAAVIVLDTPGGLEDSMRKIVQKELGADACR